MTTFKWSDFCYKSPNTSHYIFDLDKTVETLHKKLKTKIRIEKDI